MEQLDNALDILQMWLTPAKRFLLWQFGDNPQNLLIEHPELLELLDIRISIAFPEDVEVLFTVTQTDNPQARINLVTLMLQRYFSLGLPSYLGFPFIHNYIQWLTAQGASLELIHIRPPVSRPR